MSKERNPQIVEKKDNYFALVKNGRTICRDLFYGYDMARIYPPYENQDGIALLNMKRMVYLIFLTEVEKRLTKDHM